MHFMEKKHLYSWTSKITLLLFVLSVYYMVSSRAEGGGISIAANKSFPAVIMFGDSIADTGNNNYNPNSLARCNFPPYGKDFKGGIPTGRFSNGKVPSDLIAEELGIKELIPPYLDPSLQPNDLLTGVSFAVGGVGYDPLTAKLVDVTTLSGQLEQFKEYIGKLNAIVGVERSKSIVAKSLIIVVASSNDIANTFSATGVRKWNYDIPSYTDLMLNYASQFFKSLYGLGVRRFGVFSAPPVGCVPSQRTLLGGFRRDCAEDSNQAALLFNSKLSAHLDYLNKNLPNANFLYIDVYNPLLDIINNPNKYGFENAIKGCCGTGDLEVAILCNQLEPTTCQDDSKYVFWDSYHPTERAYKIIVQELGPPPFLDPMNFGMHQEYALRY
ncbi:GDSL esterase/lipase EXL3-like [Ziziphus jujuba]|uniref:GDSL esterase/lipase EXL3-like n=1 Tax=Ziziphus jujuba TaxID=326968 RepID=A0ABM4A8G1_ZIZJJ|nr:GDSL esterase/lipase EXL3-like [Ziziphus jujuba]